ncbi:MAG: hypothetical protein KDA37_18830, partial [Planctomycetales bacterium]|nr:hypothetical protein [Planctomycetales bacterium]
MKYCVALMLLLGFLQVGWGQTGYSFEEGEVSYVGSKKVNSYYVKMLSTKGINEGDTLFVQQAGAYLPALRVKGKSSSSLHCENISAFEIKRGDTISAKVPKVKEEKKEEEIPFEETKKQDETAPVLDPSTLAEQERLEREERLVKDSLRQIALDKKIEERRNQGRGRISIGMNSNINKESPSHNIRYTFSYRDRKIGKTNFSTESYVVF